MRRPGPRARLARLSIGVVLATIGLVLPAWSGTAPRADALSAWAGGMDLYRSSAFSTQQSWLWCTAADVQIMRNLVDHEADHIRASQQRYFSYMRAHDRYAMPVSDGTEPSGWAADSGGTSTGGTGSSRARASTLPFDPRSRASGRRAGRSGCSSHMATMRGS